MNTGQLKKALGIKDNPCEICKGKEGVFRYSEYEPPMYVCTDCYYGSKTEEELDDIEDDYY